MMILGLLAAWASPLRPPLLSLHDVQAAATVTVTGVAADNSSVKISYRPVPGAKDYRIYDVANPSSVKYAGLVHLTADPSCPGNDCQHHFVVKADGVTPAFPYRVANGATGGPQALDTPATTIEWNDLGDGRPHTLVVQAVNALGPVSRANLYQPSNNTSLIKPRPLSAMPGSNTGSTADGKVSTNGQGPYTDHPRIIAQSHPFVVQGNQHDHAIPSTSNATSRFFDTFRNAEGATIKRVYRKDRAKDAVGNLGIMRYTMNAGTKKAWDIEYRQADNTNSMPFISSDHFMDMLFDGATLSVPGPMHTIYGSMAMTPVRTADMSHGKILHLTMEVDGHLSFRRWIAFDLSPASDPLQAWAPDAGYRINRTDRGLFLAFKPGGCTLDIFTRSTSATDPSPTGTAGGTAHGARLWGQAGSVGGAPVMCWGENMYDPRSFSDDGLGFDNRSRYDFFVSQTHAALFINGRLIVQSAIPKGAFPWANGRVKVYYSHYLYHSDADLQDVMNYLCYPMNAYWFNDPRSGTRTGQTACKRAYPAGFGFPHSDERHWDNMGFEVLPKSLVTSNGDVSRLGALIAMPRVKPPRFIRSKY